MHLQTQRIQPFTMPLMSLAATALDQPKPREEVVAAMLQYLPTDSAVCRDEPGLLASRQAQVRRALHRQRQGSWLPLLAAVLAHAPLLALLQGRRQIRKLRPMPYMAHTNQSLLPLQHHGRVLDWAEQQMGVRLEPTDSIFGASLGQEQLAAVEAHMQVGWLEAEPYPALVRDY